MAHEPEIPDVTGFDDCMSFIEKDHNEMAAGENPGQIGSIGSGDHSRTSAENHVKAENHSHPEHFDSKNLSNPESCFGTTANFQAGPVDELKIDFVSPEFSGDIMDQPLFAISSHTSPDASYCEKPQANVETVGEIKRNLAQNSRLLGTFTVLRNTYLKLCKEFNYLLGKFNENERIKIELIHENNELRRLLWETIVEKEMDRKKCRDLH